MIIICSVYYPINASYQYIIDWTSPCNTFEHSIVTPSSWCSAGIEVLRWTNIFTGIYTYIFFICLCHFIYMLIKLIESTLLLTRRINIFGWRRKILWDSFYLNTKMLKETLVTHSLAIKLLDANNQDPARKP